MTNARARTHSFSTAYVERLPRDNRAMNLRFIALLPQEFHEP